jgi:RNA-directed DNA polymerase
VGFFDWLGKLFGGGRDYGDGLHRSYHGAYSKGMPLAVPKQQRRAYQVARFKRRPGTSRTGPDERIYSTRKGWLGKISDARLGHLGGTRECPDPFYDPGKVAGHKLPDIPHLDELARLLGLTRNQLLRFAVRSNYDQPKGTHYLLHRIPKKSGGERLLMAPMPKLKAIQRRLNEALVQHLPVHPAAHGFRRGRNVKTGAEPHIGKDVVISMDIADFFPTFTFRRVSGYFRHLGYGRGTAVALANLVTFSIYMCAVYDRGPWTYPDVPGLDEYSSHPRPLLPQGAPTSPGIANAICMGLDKRLSALAAKFGADYTRYADDLTFSGGEELRCRARPFIKLVEKIIASEGLQPNRKKTRIMSKGRRQQVNGIVVNEHPNLSRHEFDRLKAILHNCIRHGPASQNRDNHPDFQAHLQGRVAHALHISPKRGAKLKALLDQVQWGRGAA